MFPSLINKSWFDIGPGGSIPILAFSLDLIIYLALGLVFIRFDDILLEMNDFHYNNQSPDIIYQDLSTLFKSLLNINYFSIFLLRFKAEISSSRTLEGLCNMFLYISKGLNI